MKFSLLLVGLLISIQSFAQLDVPAPSPGASFTQKFGLTEIKIEYSRPSLKGRKMFGDAVPFGEIWRTGANGQTKFTTTDSLTIGGKGLSKGTYTIFTIPNLTEWEVIFNKNPKTDYTNYKPSDDDVLKVKIAVENLSKSVESFSIFTNNITATTCDLEISWDKTLIKIPLVNEINTKIMAQIKKKLDGPTAGEYQGMAQYYYDSGQDLKMALEFVDKAVTKSEGYGNQRLKALILGKMGDKKGAIEWATKSRDRAKKNNNMDYVRLNEKSIAEWSK